jgi:hypothetical protein
MIPIIIPSYGRADKALAVWANASSNTLGENEVVFVVEEEDYEDYLEALVHTTGPDVILTVNQRSKNYGGAVNSALQHGGVSHRATEIFMGADDLNFHRGWDQPAMKTLYALPHLQVVGTNDLLNEYVLAGWHATHSLVTREYIEEVGGVIDGDLGHVLADGYSHNYVDTEFIGTAKARAVFAPCLESVVEHLHASIGKSEKDATFEKNAEGIQKDCDLYYSRRQKWWDISK